MVGRGTTPDLSALGHKQTLRSDRQSDQAPVLLFRMLEFIVEGVAKWIAGEAERPDGRT